MSLEAYDRRVQSGSMECRFGGVRLGMFDEASALETKTRLHESGNGISGKEVKVLPFGCEYEIVRSWERVPGILRRAVDVRPLHGGVIKECMLDTLTVTGKVAGISVIRDDGTADCCVTSGREMPVAFEFEFADGSLAELMTGDDLWRHRMAQTLGAESEWRLSKTDDRVILERTMLRFPEEALPPNRPWRWEYALLWGRKGAEGDFSKTIRVDASGLCFAAPAVQKKFRNLVRQTTESIRLAGVSPRLCTESGHAGRTGTFLHTDTGALTALYLWANKMLQKKGLHFTVEFTPETVASRPVLAAVFGNPPREEE